MIKKRTISAIDAGNTKICTLIAEVGNDGQMRIAGVGIAPSKGMHKGTVVNINEAKEAVQASIKQAEQSSGYKVRSAYVSVTGHKTSGRNDRGVVAIMHHDHLVRAEDIRRVLDIAQVSQIGADQRILHLIPRHYAVEGQDAVQNPIGMHAFKLESETHVITTSVSSVQDLVKCIRSVDVEVEDLVFAGLASSNAVLTEDDKQAGTILADIGGGTVEISVFKDGSIWHTAVIPAGGFQVTEDISVGLNLPFEVAEELKKKYGAVPPVSDDKPDNDTIIMSGQKISHKQLYDIIRARAEELLRLIIIDLPKDEKGVVVPGGLVLTGGGANLAGIDILGSEVLKMPVRVNRPLNFYSAGDQLNDPAYATVIGLLMWGLKPKSNGK